jgi:hypothetical protein
MSQDKKILTKEQAKEVLALDKKGMVHTFLNAPFGLIGADHSKKSIYKDIDCAERLEITGEQAQSMNHGLAIIPKGATKQGDILFVETNMEVLKKYDKK